MFDKGLGIELNSDLENKVINHRNEFYYWFVNKYLEGLTSLFYYKTGGYTFDKVSLELALRRGYNVVYGENSKGVLSLIGYIPNTYDYNSNPIFYRRRYTGKDITFLIPEYLRLPKRQYLEITEQDNAEIGNFVVFQNKRFTNSSDLEIIKFYARELAEIVASRYSLEIQSKVSKMFFSEINDESINQLVTKLYNGAPYIKAGENFDIRDNVYEFNNSQFGTLLESLKNEYQAKLAEINSQFGVNVLSISKESGVSQSESNGNLGYVNFNANIYLESRQRALNLINKHYGFNWSVELDNQSVPIIGGEQVE